MSLSAPLHPVLALLVSALVAFGGLAPAAAVSAEESAAAPIAQITEGSLTWGLRQSFREYVGLAQTHVSGGTSMDEAGVLTFPLVSGTFDEASGATTLQFGGTVHYLSYCGYMAGWADDECVLDVKISDPLVIISGDAQVIRAHIVNRGGDAETGSIVPPHIDHGVIDLVTLNSLNGTVETSEGITAWDGVTSAITAVATPIFGFYAPGAQFDPVSIRYEGPGARPVVDDTWTPAGSMAVAESKSWTSSGSQAEITALFLDEAHGVVHVVNTTPPTSAPVVQALDADSLEVVGDTGAFAAGMLTGSVRSRAFDPATSTVFLHVPVNGTSSAIYAARWTGDSYDISTVAELGALTPSSGLVWDENGQRLLARMSVSGTEYIYAWRFVDGGWLESTYALPVVPGWRYLNYYSTDIRQGMVALGDGSVLLMRQSILTETVVNGVTTRQRANQPKVLRIVLGDEVQVQELDATGTNTPLPSGTATDYPSSVVTDGRNVAIINRHEVSATEPRYDVLFGTLRDVGLVFAASPVALPISTTSQAKLIGAFDPMDGTLWIKENGSGRFLGISSDGAIIADLSHPDSVSNQPLVVDSDHAIFTATRNAARSPGVARLDRLGISPTITTQPESAQASIGADELTDTVTFAAAAEGTPAPAVQWQKRAPGALRFSAVDDATSTSLVVEVSAADNGTEYRAVFSNAAGAIATQSATLSVLSAPTITQEPRNATVTPGADAYLQVVAAGNPEPEVQWQRYVDDEWVAVSGTGFEADGGNLTVRDAQASAQFRAKVSNSQGTVYSTVASLTVELPQGGEDGSITGLPNSVGARTTVTPAVELAADDTVKVAGSGFVKGSNEAGAYLLFGYVTKFPSADGALGAGYDYIPGQDKQRFVAWPESETAGSANGSFAPDGGFAVDGLAVASSFTGASGATVDCLDNSVQCGVITIGAHGGRDANLETFTPVYFEGQSPNVAKRTPVVSSSPVSASVTEGQDALFSAGATGWPIPAVRWQSRLADAGDWVDIPGATTASYRVAEATLGASGTRYRAVFTNSEGTATTDAATLTVTKAPAAPATQAGSLTWGVKASFRSYVVGPTAKGAISISGGASSSGGAFRFGQSSATWDAAAGTGTAGYGGAVRFTGHAGILDVTLSDPGITVTSASSATLSVTANGSRLAIGNVNLAAAVKSTVTGGVGYANAPVTLTAAGVNVFSYGSSQFYGVGTAMDPVSFVIGANATGGGGSTRVAAFQSSEWTPPADPPATTGIEGDPAELSEVHAGQELTVWADGFQPGEPGIKVVVYSEPIVLETDLTADASGRASWTGILPAELEPGEHTLTFQGSVNRGIVLDVKPAVAFEGCTVEDATLSWGFKESFRAYIDGSIANGAWTVSDGASYETPLFGWSDGTGVYDVDTASGQVDFTGAIRFTGHDGLLDTTVANPRLQFVDADTAYLLLDVAGVTMEDALAGETEPVVVTAVPFVKLDLGGGAVELSADGTTLTGTEVPTAITAQGYAAFPNYEAGTAFDPVSFTVAVGSDCTTAIPAATDEEPTTDAVASPGPDLAWLWWALAAVLIGAVVATVVVLLVRRRRAG